MILDTVFRIVFRTQIQKIQIYSRNRSISSLRFDLTTMEVHSIQSKFLPYITPPFGFLADRVLHPKLPLKNRDIEIL